MEKNTCNFSKKNHCKNKKFDFNNKKNTAIKSLSEVEMFLRNFNKFTNYIKLYKIIKK